MSLQNRNFIVAFWLVIIAVGLPFALSSWLRPLDPEEKIRVFVGDTPIIAKRKYISRRLQSPPLENGSRVERLSLYYYIDPGIKTPQRVHAKTGSWSHLKFVSSSRGKWRGFEKILDKIETGEAVSNENEWFGFSTPKGFSAHTFPKSSTLPFTLYDRWIFYRNLNPKISIVGKYVLLIICDSPLSFEKKNPARECWFRVQLRKDLSLEGWTIEFLNMPKDWPRLIKQIDLTIRTLIELPGG